MWSAKSASLVSDYVPLPLRVWTAGGAAHCFLLRLMRIWESHQCRGRESWIIKVEFLIMFLSATKIVSAGTAAVAAGLMPREWSQITL